MYIVKEALKEKYVRKKRKKGSEGKRKEREGK